MSKLDGLRAMREARYEQAAARAKKAPAAPQQAKPRTPSAPAARPAESQAPAETAELETPLCGHRSMNGRTCTREQGHAAKSHRYS